MDYAAAQTALAAWVQALTGLTQVIWENEARPFVAGGRVAILSWLTTATRGVDELRWDDTGLPAPDPDLVPTLAGVRVLGLQIAVETLSQDPSTLHARAALERLRDRLRRPSSRATLAAAGLGLVDASDVTPADYRSKDNRWVSRAVLDVRFNATSLDRDTDEATPSIATVQLTPEVTP